MLPPKPEWGPVTKTGMSYHPLRQVLTLAVAAMGPGHEDRDEFHHRKLWPRILVAAMGPGHEDRDEAQAHRGNRRRGRRAAMGPGHEDRDEGSWRTGPLTCHDTGLRERCWSRPAWPSRTGRLPHMGVGVTWARALPWWYAGTSPLAALQNMRACGRQRARSTNEPDFGGRAQRTEVDANDAVLVVTAHLLLAV